jgi:signal transduction histidine kinase
VSIKRARDILQRELDTTLGNVEELARSLAACRQELETALDTARAAVADAEAANRAKSDFLSVMSHELRTPLNAVIGFLDLLQAGTGGELTDAQLPYVDRARHSSQHLLKLVEQILSYTKMEAGTEEVRWEHSDLRAIVEAVGEMIAPTAAAKGLDLQVEVPNEAVPVHTDPDKAKQILLNLAGNAVKIHRRGSVSISVRSEADRAIVTVRDTGPGIPPEQREKIFEPFWQADTCKTRAVEGTGLGWRSSIVSRGCWAGRSKSSRTGERGRPSCSA